MAKNRGDKVPKRLFIVYYPSPGKLVITTIERCSDTGFDRPAMKRTIALLFLLCLVAGPASAQSYDPFLSDLEENTFPEQLTGNRPDKDEAKTFSGPMERLLHMAGEDKKVDPDHWTTFTKPPKNPGTTNLLMELQLRRDMEARPKKKAEPAYDRLDELTRDLKDTNQKRKEKAEEHYFKHAR